MSFWHEFLTLTFTWEAKTLSFKLLEESNVIECEKWVHVLEHRSLQMYENKILENGDKWRSRRMTGNDSLNCQSLWLPIEALYIYTHNYIYIVFFDVERKVKMSKEVAQNTVSAAIELVQCGAFTRNPVSYSDCVLWFSWSVRNRANLGSKHVLKISLSAENIRFWKGTLSPVIFVLKENQRDIYCFVYTYVCTCILQVRKNCPTDTVGLDNIWDSLKPTTKNIR